MTPFCILTFYVLIPRLNYLGVSSVDFKRSLGYGQEHIITVPDDSESFGQHLQGLIQNRFHIVNRPCISLGPRWRQ